MPSELVCCSFDWDENTQKKSALGIIDGQDCTYRIFDNGSMITFSAVVQSKKHSMSRLNPLSC